MGCWRMPVTYIQFNLRKKENIINSRNNEQMSNTKVFCLMKKYLFNIF